MDIITLDDVILFEYIMKWQRLEQGYWPVWTIACDN